VRWLSAGETIEVAGENITIGLIYVGEDKTGAMDLRNRH